MEVLKTIKEVFSYNLRRLRGKRTQEEISAAAGIPYRTYQDMESGVIPREKWVHLERLARFHAVPETALFLDPDLTRPTGEQLKSLLREALTDPGIADQIAAVLAAYSRTKR